MQILTDIAVAEMAGSAVKAEALEKDAVKQLLAKKSELLAAIACSKRNFKVCKDAVSRLRKQVQAEQESHKGKSGHIVDSPIQFDLQEARIKLEKSLADPVVSKKRISVAKATLLLLQLIANAENAYEAADGALHLKSQARVHSQVSSENQPIHILP